MSCLILLYLTSSFYFLFHLPVSCLILLFLASSCIIREMRARYYMDSFAYLQYNCKSGVDIDRKPETLYSNAAHAYVYATILIPVPGAQCGQLTRKRISCLILLVLALSCYILFILLVLLYLVSPSYIFPNPVHLASSCCVVYVHACMLEVNTSIVVYKEKYGEGIAYMTANRMHAYT